MMCGRIIMVFFSAEIGQGRGSGDLKGWRRVLRWEASWAPKSRGVRIVACYGGHAKNSRSHIKEFMAIAMSGVDLMSDDVV